MKRTERITVLLTEKEKQYIKRRAQLEKRSISDHVRLIYLQRVHLEALSEEMQRGLALKGMPPPIVNCECGDRYTSRNEFNHHLELNRFQPGAHKEVVSNDGRGEN